MKKWEWIILNVYLPVGGAILLGVLLGIYIPIRTNEGKGNLTTGSPLEPVYNVSYGRSNQVSKTAGDLVTYYDVKDPALLKPYIEYEVLNRTKGSFKISVDGKEIELYPSGFTSVKKIGVVTVVPSEDFDGVISLTIKK